jgi:Phage integrase, N-terminal SAM-like domain
MAWVEQHRSRYRVRIRMPDGSVGVDSSHPIRAAAEIRCKQVDVEQALDTYIDPARGRITLAEWVAIWETGHLAGAAKWAAYRSHLRIHILPAFGDTPLNQITRHTVKLFVKRLKTRLADASVSSVMTLFGLLMREAVADRRIPHNPCHGVRVVTQRAAERPHATAARSTPSPPGSPDPATSSWSSPRRTPACAGASSPVSPGPTPTSTTGSSSCTPRSVPCTRSVPSSTSARRRLRTRRATFTCRRSWSRS